MRIENGIYYTDEEIDITNIYEVVKRGFDEALELAVEGKVKGFAAVSFDKKYGWNGSMYYELINLDYQDLSEYNPEISDDEQAVSETEALLEEQADAFEQENNVDIASLIAENQNLKDEIEKLRPIADKYTSYADVIGLFEEIREAGEEKLVAEIDRFKKIFSSIAEDAQAILEKIEN